MAHTELSLVPADGCLAQSCARDLCQSMGLIPELSAPTGFPRSPFCVISRPENLKHQNPRGAEREVLGLLERSWRQELPAISTPQPKQTQTPPKGCSHTSAARMELIKHFPSFPTALAHPRLRRSHLKPDRNSTSSHQHIPAAAEPPGSKPAQQPHAGPCRAGNPKC